MSTLVPDTKIDIMNEKVLVTGGAGFIGSHIVDLFISNNYEVIVIDDLTSGKKENIHKDAKFYQLNITDTKEIESIFRKERPDYLVHEAAQISVSFSVRNPLIDAQINVIGSLNLFHNCVKYNVKGIIFASSGGTVYGEPDTFPVAENQVLSPLSPYGISKVAVENYLDFYKKNYQLDYVSLRYGNVYGPRQDPFGEAGVIAIFIKKMLKGDIPTINGDGEYIRDYVYVKDVANANLIALKNIKKQSRRISFYKENTTMIQPLNGYNVGTGIGTSVNGLFSMLKEIIHFPSSANYGPARPGDLRKNILNCRRIDAIFKWKPQTDLYKGLSETTSWFKKNYS